MNLEATFQEITKGDRAAQEFCWSFYRMVHAIDDLVDREPGADVKTICIDILRGLHVFSHNTFYEAYKGHLWPLIHQAVVTFVYSNDLLARPDTRSRVIGEVVKSEYQCVFFMVAFLLGGIEHQLAMQNKFRDCWFG